MRIAYAGAEGAFAHEACLAFAPGIEPVALPDFAAVVRAVETGAAERGMLPVRNSRAGEEPEVRTLLMKAAVKLGPAHALPVRMHLLGLPGTSLGDLEVVTSHPMALKQCAGSIARLGLATRPASNTAVAARSLRERSVGVLASEAAASAYGLQLLRADMQDDPENMTTFVIIEALGNGG
jgi:prephenate dehydratase